VEVLDLIVFGWDDDFAGFVDEAELAAGADGEERGWIGDGEQREQGGDEKDHV
jgi:hypothetical protein